MNERAEGFWKDMGRSVRPFAAVLGFTPIAASALPVANGANPRGYAHAVNMAIVFAGLTRAGGGRCAPGNHLPGLRGMWFA